MKTKLLFALLAGAAPASLLAQAEAPAPPAEALVTPEDELDPEAGEEIVVTGTRLRGAVDSDIPPEIQLDRRDIRATGASSVAELLEAISPQTRSGRGRDGGGGPVTLLNGRRISGFNEIRDLPPEAIERVDVLPEEVALQYGYRPDQRVVNIVLRRRFRAITGELEYGQATVGGRGSYEVDINMLRLNRNGRWSLDFEYERDNALLESQRDIIQSSDGAPFAIGGNIGASPFGGEIDPALSGLAGESVTVAGVSTGLAAAPTLADFAGRASDPNLTDLGRYRTLLPATEQMTFGGTLNRTVLGDVSASVNGRLELTSSESRFGLPTLQLNVPESNPFSPFSNEITLFRSFDENGPLVRESEGRKAHVGVALNGDLRPWRWSFTSNYDNNSSNSRTDTGLDPASVQARLDAGDAALNPFGAMAGDLLAFRPADRSRSVSDVFTSELVLNGPVLTLPAGPVTASVRAGFDARGLSSDTIRSGLPQSRDLSRKRGTVQANLDVPVAQRDAGGLGAIGDLSVNVNAEVERFSDFGTLTTFGGGLNWSPREEVRFSASFTDEDGAPSMEQLGNPTQLTPNVRVFDFLRGETVDIGRLDGGNPDLLADNRRVLNLRVNVEPIEDEDLSLMASYTSSVINNPIASFPTATPEIEAAFPDRFLRDEEGRLLRIDSRPVNFERLERSEIRWGINWSEPIGPQGPPPGARRAAREAARAGQPGAAPGAERPRRDGGGGRGWGGGGRGFGGGGRGGFGGGGGGGRLQLALFHTIHLSNEILIREGVPVLDLLNGSATGSNGGQPRHEVEIQAALYRNGFGGRLTGNWRSGTEVTGVELPGEENSNDLFFSDRATLNLRLFADLGAQQSLVRRHRWLRGTRVGLSIDNITDSRTQVRDGSGATPLGYQPDLLDPLGRSFRVTIRKLFF